MASGAVLSSEREAPKKRLATFVCFNVPIVRTSEFSGREVELLLLAWALLLYRYSNGNHIQFTWGRNGTAADFTFNTSGSWNASDPIAKALKSVQSYRQEIQAGSLAALDNAILFFNDECAPNDLPSNARVSDGDELGGGMAWVRELLVANFMINYRCAKFRET